MKRGDGHYYLVVIEKLLISTDSIINFDDPNNTLTYGITSYNDWSKDNGIMSNIFANSLYEGLNLFDT